MKDAVFYASAAVAVVAALFSVTRRNPVYSALWLLVAFVAFAVIFLDLHAPFLAAMHVLVYTGAILVLFLFVIMLLNLQKEELQFDYPLPGRAVLGAFCVLLAALLIGLFVTSLQKAQLSPPPPEEFGGATAVGNAIFPDVPNATQHFIFPFELVSVLVIAAMIGAIILARPERKEPT